MRRIFLMLFGAVIAGALSAQVLTEGESALVYYSPKTIVVVDFAYTVEKAEQGAYAEYAEAMLGIEDAVKENQTVCTLTGATVSTNTVADRTRPHKVSAENGIPLLLNINEKGLLVGYNAPETVAKQKHKPSSVPSKKAKPKSRPVPYPEDVLKANGEEAQAYEVAKQIFHIRETRMYLLSGEVENAPADGKAMELVLNELNKQEEALTELFTGKRSKVTKHKRIYYDHIDIHRKEGAALKGYVYPLFFSEGNGFTNAENIEADTIRVTVRPSFTPFYTDDSNNAKGKKKKIELSEIVYNLPGQCLVEIRYKGRRLAEKEIPLAQTGMDVPLPKDMFTGSELPKIIFSEKTGNIVSISK